MEHKTRFRNHISIILEQTGAAIAGLFILAATAVFQSLDEITSEDISALTDRSLLILLSVTALLLFSVLSQVFVWSKTYISIEENAVVIEKGSINKKKNTIGIRNISNINLEQNLLEMILGTCKVKLDTNSLSTADSTDVKIVLKKADALWFQQTVTEKLEAGRAGMDAGAVRGENPGEGETYDVRADIGDIISHGVFSISVVSVALLLLVIVGTVFSVKEFLDDPGVIGTIAGGTAAVVIAVLIAGSALWDTVKDFVKYYDFRAKRRDDKIYIKYGFLKKVEYTIPVDKIQALKLRQSFVARIGGRYMAEIVNVGMGDDQEERHSFLVLYCTPEKLKERLLLLLPEYARTVDQPVERIPYGAWAAWSLPATVYLAVVLCCSYLCSFILDGQMSSDAYRLPVLLVTVAFILGMPVVLLLVYRTAGVGMGGHFLKITRGYFGKEIISVKYGKIQYVEFKQNLIAKAWGIKKGEIHLLAASDNACHSIPYFTGNKEEIIKRGMLIF